MLISRIFCAAVLAACLTANASQDEKTLKFFHTHTGESIEVCYYRDGAYDARSLNELNRFLADFRTGQSIEMDPRVFDVLYSIKSAAGSKGTFEVISAYRSPETNEMLRAKSLGVAKKSQHLLGNAMDVRLTDVDTRVLRDIAKSLEMGGVGYYRKSKLGHIDVGRVRYW